MKGRRTISLKTGAFNTLIHGIGMHEMMCSIVDVSIMYYFDSGKFKASVDIKPQPLIPDKMEIVEERPQT